MATIDPTKLSIKFNNVTYTTSDPVNKLTVIGNDFTFEITVPTTGDYDVEPTYDGVPYNTQTGTDVKVLGATITKNYNVAFGHYMDFYIAVNKYAIELQQPLKWLDSWTGMTFKYDGVEYSINFTITSTDSPAQTAYTNLVSRTADALSAAGLTDITVSLGDPTSIVHPTTGAQGTIYAVTLHSPTKTFDASKGTWTLTGAVNEVTFTEVRTYDI